MVGFQWSWRWTLSVELTSKTDCCFLKQMCKRNIYTYIYSNNNYYYYCYYYIYITYIYGWHIPSLIHHMSPWNFCHQGLFLSASKSYPATKIWRGRVFEDVASHNHCLTGQDMVVVSNMSEASESFPDQPIIHSMDWFEGIFTEYFAVLLWPKHAARRTWFFSGSGGIRYHLIIFNPPTWLKQGYFAYFGVAWVAPLLSFCSSSVTSWGPKGNKPWWQRRDAIRILVVLSCGFSGYPLVMTNINSYWTWFI
jgi:hypothetical protein